MKTVYWTSTILISMFLLWSAYTYLFSKPTMDGVKSLGFPDHFRIELAVLKIIGAILLVTPQIPMQVKEWAYAGIALFLITAIVAHAAHKDPFFINLINICLLAILIISNIFLHKLN